MSKRIKKRGYHKARIKRDATKENRGWVVGHFSPNGPRRTGAVEIKYWEFTKTNKPAHPTKRCRVLECTIVLKGRVNGIVDGKPIALSAGDYIVIKPGVANNLVKSVPKPAVGITIKAPSILCPDEKLP